MKVTLAGTITEALDDVLASDPDRVAVVDPRRSLTYSELDRNADAAAAALSALGVRAGDRVAACLPNEVDIVVAFHGAMRLGAIWVGINRPLAPAEKDTLLHAAQPVVLLAEPKVAAEHHDPSWRTLTVESADRSSTWRAALTAAAGASRLPPPDPDAAAAVAFTSGTTGSPRGIVHSQRNLLLPAAALVAASHYDKSLRKGDCLPLTILNLQVLTSLLTAAAGGCCVLTDRRDARGIAEWIESERVTVWNGVPTQLYSMVHDPEIEAAQFSSLREAWAGGAPCPEDVFRQFLARFGVPLRQTYGLTEAPTVVAIEDLAAPHVAGASGRPLPHLRVTVRGDDGTALPPLDMGEISVSAVREGPWAGRYQPHLGLWRDGGVERSADDGLLRTGDIGYLDDHGNLFVRDRKSLVIIRGGANVYPTEVEQLLDRVPGVRASAVVGLPDDRLGQRVAAAVEVDPASPATEASIQEILRVQLAKYKVPERIMIIDWLPRNAMGKVRRQAVLDLLASGETSP